MVQALAKPSTQSRFMRRLVSSLLGAVATCLLAPVAWFVVVLLFQPSALGLGARLLTLLSAAPAIVLFAAVVSFPVCAVLGPAVLALASRHTVAPQRFATFAGALIGAIVLAVPSWLSSASSTGYAAGLSAFGALLGAAGAWVAAKHHFMGVPSGENAPAA